MHAAASIPLGAVVSLLIIAIATVAAINAVLHAARRGPASGDVVSLERHRQQRDALRDITR